MIEMRFRSLTIVIAMFLLAVSALPALADPPNQSDEPSVNTFDAWNPCLGVFEKFTLVFTPFDHFHSNNVVFQDKDRHGETASGFLMEHGQFHVVGVDDGPFVRHFNDVFRHPDGDAFRTKGTLRFAGNSPVVDTLKSTCLGAPTIPQP